MLRHWFQPPVKLLNERWPSDRPLVSVIIPCFNYGGYLPEAVQSVRNQTWKNFEIIIVEGGSTDGTTKSVVRSFESDNIRCVYQNTRCSIGQNRLSGLQAARGKYIVFLDADDMIAPTYLERAVYLMETQGLDVVTPWAKLLGDRRAIRNALQGRPEDHWETLGLPLPAILENNQCDTTAMFRYSFWKDHEIGYNCDLQLEDWDFWIRFARHGARFDVIRAPLHLYRLHGMSTTCGLASSYQEHVQAIREEWKWLACDRKQLLEAVRRQRRRVRVINPLVNFSSLDQSKNKIRVLLCVPWFDMGGSSVLMKEIFSSLTEKVDVIAVSTLPSTDAFTENGRFLYDSFAKECFSIGAGTDSEEAKSLITYIAQTRKVDLVFVVGSRLAYETLSQLKREIPDIKVIDQLYNPVGHVLSNQEFREDIDYNIAASEEVVAKLLELGEKRSRIQIIPHGVDEQVFNAARIDSRPFARQKTGNRFCFGFLGRLSEEKRPQDMLALAKRIPEADFVVGGTGPMGHELEQWRTEDGVENLSFLGYVDNPLAVYCKSDAIIIPSRIEGLPITLLEAMSLQKPVIAAEVGEIGHVIRNEENGFLFRSGDIEALEAIARKLMSLDPAQLSKVGAHARDTIVRNFSIRQCAQNYLNVFTAILKRGLPI